MMDYHNPNENWLSPELMKDLKPEDAQKVGCFSAIGTVVAIIIGLLFCTLLGSCRSHKDLVSEHNERDSVRVETRIETVYITDTCYVEIPAQTAERTTADSVSHLENDYATSDARINADGTLTHTLATKPQKKPVEFQKPVEHRDSIVYRDKVVTKTDVQIKEVERNLSWWEQTRIYGCYVLAILLVILYRKPIWKFVKKLVLRLPL